MYLKFETIIRTGSETFNIIIFRNRNCIRIWNHAIEIETRSEFSMVPFQTRPICIPTLTLSRLELITNNKGVLLGV